MSIVVAGTMKIVKPLATAALTSAVEAIASAVTAATTGRDQWIVNTNVNFSNDLKAFRLVLNNNAEQHFQRLTILHFKEQVIALYIALYKSIDAVRLSFSKDSEWPLEESKGDGYGSDFASFGCACFKSESDLFSNKVLRKCEISKCTCFRSHSDLFKTKVLEPLHRCTNELWFAIAVSEDYQLVLSELFLKIEKILTDTRVRKSSVLNWPKLVLIVRFICNDNDNSSDVFEKPIGDCDEYHIVDRLKIKIKSLMMKLTHMENLVKGFIKAVNEIREQYLSIFNVCRCHHTGIHQTQSRHREVVGNLLEGLRAFEHHLHTIEKELDLRRLTDPNIDNLLNKLALDNPVPEESTLEPLFAMVLIFINLIPHTSVAILCICCKQIVASVSNDLGEIGGIHEWVVSKNRKPPPPLKRVYMDVERSSDSFMFECRRDSEPVRLFLTQHKNSIIDTVKPEFKESLFIAFLVDNEFVDMDISVRPLQAVPPASEAPPETPPAFVSETPSQPATELVPRPDGGYLLTVGETDEMD